MRFRILALTSVAIAGAGLAMLGTSAQAEPVQGAEKERHCVAALHSTACYATFTEAIAAATGGRVADAPADASAAAEDPRLAARLNASGTKTGAAPAAVAADIVIAIEYEDSDFEGSTYTVIRPWGCTGTTSDVDWSVPSLPGDWNDEIGSYRTFANCWAKHFEHINFGGISTAFDAGQADMGWMDDETSSIQYS